MQLQMFVLVTVICVVFCMPDAMCCI